MLITTRRGGCSPNAPFAKLWHYCDLYDALDFCDLGLHRRLEAAVMPDEVDVRLVLDRAARLERGRGTDRQ